MKHLGFLQSVEGDWAPARGAWIFWIVRRRHPVFRFIHSCPTLTPCGGTQPGVSRPHNALYTSTPSRLSRASTEELELEKERNAINDKYVGRVLLV